MFFHTYNECYRLKYNGTLASLRLHGDMDSLNLKGMGGFEVALDMDISKGVDHRLSQAANTAFSTCRVRLLAIYPSSLIECALAKSPFPLNIAIYIRHFTIHYITIL